MGFGGPAYPRGYMRLGMALDEHGDQREPWEKPETHDIDAQMLRDNEAHLGSKRKADAPEDVRWLKAEAARAERISRALAANPPRFRGTGYKGLLKARFRPEPTTAPGCCTFTSARCRKARCAVTPMRTRSTW